MMEEENNNDKNKKLLKLNFFDNLLLLTVYAFQVCCLFFGNLQIPLAPQRILCGPQELNKKCNQDIKVFFIFNYFYTFQTCF
jgi:hypothetical protein